jgi:hypothetical protein
MIKICRQTSMKQHSLLVFSLSLCVWLSQTSFADFLADLARPHEGRSMRETSTHKIGPDGKFDPKATGIIKVFPPAKLRC